MPRQATGQVLKKAIKGRDGKGDVSYLIRFRVPVVSSEGVEKKERVCQQLGYASEGWTDEKAQCVLDDTMAAVRLGLWRPPEAPSPIEVGADPLFHEFASDWWANKQHDLGETTRVEYEDQLVNDILPFFKSHRLSQITVAEVDRFRDTLKLRGKVPPQRADGTGGRATPRDKREPLSARTVNKRISRLGQILEVAVERDLITRNPARVGKRKLKVTPPQPVFLESPLHIATMLEASGLVDADQPAYRRTIGRKPAMATLMLAGLRASEFCDATWLEVDLERDRFDVGRAKTPNSYRSVLIVPMLHNELARWKRETPFPTGPDDPVFPTRTGKARDKDNVRARVMKPVVDKANELLTARGQQPLPRGLSPHKLRHTFCSVLFAIGRDSRFVMKQLGHSRAAFTMEVYGHAMDISELERKQLKALVDGRLDWAPSGTEEQRRREEPPEAVGL